MATSDHVEYMTYPRATALSEVVWSDKQSKDYDDFITRLSFNKLRLTALNVSYAESVSS